VNPFVSANSRREEEKKKKKTHLSRIHSSKSQLVVLTNCWPRKVHFPWFLCESLVIGISSAISQIVIRSIKQASKPHRLITQAKSATSMSRPRTRGPNSSGTQSGGSGGSGNGSGSNNGGSNSANGSNHADKDKSFFIVEKLLDKKKVNKRVFYLVQWEGYSAAANTGLVFDLDTDDRVCGMN
jgi:hypothetical protein